MVSLKWGWQVILTWADGGSDYGVHVPSEDTWSEVKTTCKKLKKCTQAEKSCYKQRHIGSHEKL